MATTVDVTEEQKGQTPAPTVDDFFFHAADYVYKHKKKFMVLTGVLIAIFLAAYAINWYLEKQDTHRNEELYKIEKVLDDRSLSDEKRFEKGLPALNDFLVKFENSNQAKIALFRRGSLYFDQKKLTEAEADLTKLLEKLEKTSGIYVLTNIYLANVLRDQGKAQESIQILEGVKSETMTDLVLLELAEAYLGTGQNDKAKINLTALTEDHAKSIYANRAKQMLDLLP